MKIPTVKIKHDDGYCLINETDFDPVKHEMFESVESEPDKPKDFKSEEVKNEADAEPLVTSLVNLNTASVKALTELTSIGTNRANTIVENRDYKSIEDAKAKLPDLNWAVIESLVEV